MILFIETKLDKYDLIKWDKKKTNQNHFLENYFLFKLKINNNFF